MRSGLRLVNKTQMPLSDTWPRNHGCDSNTHVILILQHQQEGIAKQVWSRSACSLAIENIVTFAQSDMARFQQKSSKSRSRHKYTAMATTWNKHLLKLIDTETNWERNHCASLTKHRAKGHTSKTAEQRESPTNTHPHWHVESPQCTICNCHAQTGTMRAGEKSIYMLACNDK